MELVESKEYAKLSYDLYDGTDEGMMVSMLSPVVIFHGLFDHKGSWTDIAKSIADKAVRKVYVIDMRNHGDSPKMDMTHEGNVIDLKMFLKTINEPVILIGHSLGGTAAIEIAFKKPHLIKQLVLIDISPLNYPLKEDDDVIYIINQIRTVLDIVNSTEEVYELNSTLEKYFQKYIKNTALCKIILSNLKKENNKYTLKADLDAIEDLCQSKKMRKVYPLRGFYQGKTLLIHGDSDYVMSSDYGSLKWQFPNMNIIHVKNCSHLIHMEVPDKLAESIIQFLSNKF